MSKIVGITVALLIVKVGEIIVLYHALPVLRRWWEKALASGNTGLSLKMGTLQFHSAKHTAVNAIRNRFGMINQSRATSSLRGETEDD